MTAARTVGGLVYPETIEEMERELAEAIEDFDRAVDVEALRLAKKTGKYSSSYDNPSLMISCRARLFDYATQTSRDRL